MILEKIVRWLQRVFSSAELRSYETACLDAWKQELSEKPRQILERQLTRYDFIERLAEDKQINFWCLKEKTSMWPKDLCFPTRKGQAIGAATIWLRKSESRTRARLRADISVVNGRFFSIDFNKPPLAYFGIDKKDPVVPIVDDVAIRHELTHSTDPGKLLRDTGRLEGWLAEWHSRWQLSKVLEPPPATERKKLLSSFDTVFPEDYLEAVEQVGGFRVRNCKLYGLSQVEKIVHPDENFYAIAEVKDRAYIGVRQGAKRVEIYELHFEFETPELYDSTSIRAVLEREMEAKDD